MERDIFEKLRQWKIDANRKPLPLQGARQIGKTWVMREFGRREFKYVAEFNVDEVKELKQVFARTKDPQRLIMDLSLYVSVPILPEETLIQDCSHNGICLVKGIHQFLHVPHQPLGYISITMLHTFKNLVVVVLVLIYL